MTLMEALISSAPEAAKTHAFVYCETSANFLKDSPKITGIDVAYYVCCMRNDSPIGW